MPEVERGYVDGELVPAEVPLALPGNGNGGQLQRAPVLSSPPTALMLRSMANQQITMVLMRGCSRSPAAPQSSPSAIQRRPWWRLAKGLISSAADEFQLLAFKLESWAVQRDAKVFVVASAVGGKGKSFVALNLAAALAVSGSGALFDRRRYPMTFQHYAFPVPKVDGLLGYLQGAAEFASTVVPTPDARVNSDTNGREPATARRNISLPTRWAS